MTKQDQANEFREWLKQNEDDPEETTTTGIIAFWLQKQDQLLTELEESLEKEKPEWDSVNDDDFYFDAGIEKALSLINKFK